MGRLHKLLRLPAVDLLLLARAWWLFAYVDWMISHRDYASWPRWMKLEDRPGDGDTASLIAAGEEVSRVIRLTELAARNHYGEMNCLRRCIVQRQLVHAYGGRCELRIGVSSREGCFAAHAWLTSGERPINDIASNLERYSVLEQADPRFLSELR